MENETIFLGQTGHTEASSDRADSIPVVQSSKISKVHKFEMKPSEWLGRIRAPLINVNYAYMMQVECSEKCKW